jgi:hypothetical protein
MPFSESKIVPLRPRVSAAEPECVYPEMRKAAE